MSRSPMCFLRVMRRSACRLTEENDCGMRGLARDMLTDYYVWVYHTMGLVIFFVDLSSLITLQVIVAF